MSVAGHGDGAQGFAIVAQRSGGRAAHRIRPRRACRAVASGLATAGAGLKDETPGSGDGPWRRRRDADGSRQALCRPRRVRVSTVKLPRNRVTPRPTRARNAPVWWIRSPRGMSAMFCSARRRRRNAVHNRFAFKTGTSYGYRDAWAVGFDGRMTVGVWVGRPDGAPVPGLVGRNVALARCCSMLSLPAGSVAGGACQGARAVLLIAQQAPSCPSRSRGCPAGEAPSAPRAGPAAHPIPAHGSRLELTAAPGGQAEPLTLKCPAGWAP